MMVDTENRVKNPGFHDLMSFWHAGQEPLQYRWTIFASSCTPNLFIQI